MTEAQAWSLIKQAVAQYRGTLDEHATLQKALDILKPKQEEKTDG